MIYFGGVSVTSKKKLSKIHRALVFRPNCCWEFFDGASKDNKCGGRAIFLLNQNHQFQIQMGLGAGKNNFADLMALKLLLCYALDKDCRRIHIFGDSLVIINWVNKVQRCRNISLITLFEEVIRLMKNFDHITCRHV